MLGDCASDLPFEPLLRDRTEGPPRRIARGSPRAPHALSLVEFPIGSAVEEPSRAANSAPAPPQPAASTILFTEEELARICACLSSQLRRLWDQELRAQIDGLARSLEARLAQALANERQERLEQRSRVARTVARAVTAALEALVPRLRKEQLAAALELLLEESLSARPIGPLVIEAPASDVPELQARVPALLAAAGTELAYEVRPHAADDTVLRLRWQESWAEIDLEAWTRAVIDRVGDFLEGRASLAPASLAREEEPHDT